MFRVLVVDDFAIPRQLFETVVREMEGYMLAGSLSLAQSAPEFCRTNPVDLVIMDIVMSQGINGLEAAARIKSAQPDIRILMVTSMPEVSYMKKARDAGVDSFWYKEVQDQPLSEVIRRTMEGESIYPDTTPTIQLGNAASSELTPKELEVLRELTGSLTNEEIAEKLHISANTVKRHLQNIMDKTGFESRLDLAMNARALGLVVHEDDRKGNRR